MKKEYVTPNVDFFNEFYANVLTTSYGEDVKDANDDLLNWGND